MLTIIIGLISLGIIVLIHELGHYLFAIYHNVEVEEFAIGIGPKIGSFTRRNTLWSLRVLPLGGFCKMKSPNLMLVEPKTSPIPIEKGSFYDTSFVGKLMILAGGPLANVLLYIFLSLILFITGGEIQEDIPAYIDPSLSPAIESDLQRGDQILSINDIQTPTYTKLAQTTRTFTGESVVIAYSRDGETFSTSVQLNAQAPALGVMPYIAPVVTAVQEGTIAAQLGLQAGDVFVEAQGQEIQNAIQLPSLLYPEENYEFPVSFYILRNDKRIKFETNATKENLNLQNWGIQYQTITYKAWNNFAEFATQRSKQMITIVTGTFLFFTDLLQLNIKKVKQSTAGPIRLIQIVGSSTIANVRSYGLLNGLISLLNITSLLSIAIASLNLLPIPILDGGQILFYSFFAIRKKSPTVKSLMVYQSIGTIIMLLLFTFIIFSDITSFF